ncbi:MAG: flagellar biosynthetic protein FliO [Planctomycetaceae bacterium]|nr:flagellar biosynthetic protein FliO [Planctomycetaceae bacterium]
MNLRNGLSIFVWCCALTGFFFSTILEAQESFQAPRVSNPLRENSSNRLNNQPSGFQYPTERSSQSLQPNGNGLSDPLQNQNRSSQGVDQFRQLSPGVTEASSNGLPASASVEVKKSASPESRMIGGSEKVTKEDAGSDSSKKLTLVSPGKLLTAVMFVVFLILITARYWKRHIPGASIPIPTESLTVLGERKLNKNHSICLVRLGSRVLVLGASADGLRTLTEITDPVEIDFLSGMARSSQSDTVFTSALGSFLKKSQSPSSALNAKSTASNATSSRSTSRSVEVPRV